MAAQTRKAPLDTEAVPVTGNTVELATTITRPANTTAYTAKDAIADKTAAATILTFTNAAQAAGRGGYVVGATVMTDQTANTAQFKLHLFHTAPGAVVVDNAAMTAPLWTDRASYVGSIIFAAAAQEGGAGAAFAQLTTGAEPQFPMPFVCAAADSNLYGMLETLDAFTPASAQNFYLVLRIEQN
jgi:hypothetical protein